MHGRHRRKYQSAAEAMRAAADAIDGSTGGNERTTTRVQLEDEPESSATQWAERHDIHEGVRLT